MKKETIEAGIQRLYYALWAGFSCIYLFGYTTQLAEYGSSLDLAGIDALVVVGIYLGIVIAPGVLMVAVRWVYRGFFPK
jgi:hypothetical protein